MSTTEEGHAHVGRKTPPPTVDNGKASPPALFSTSRRCWRRKGRPNRVRGQRVIRPSIAAEALFVSQRCLDQESGRLSPEVLAIIGEVRAASAKAGFYQMCTASGVVGCGLSPLSHHPAADAEGRCGRVRLKGRPSPRKLVAPFLGLAHLSEMAARAPSCAELSSRGARVTSTRALPRALADRELMLTARRLVKPGPENEGGASLPGTIPSARAPPQTWAVHSHRRRGNGHRPRYRLGSCCSRHGFLRAQLRTFAT
jgi:hypothetical protein